MSRQLMEAGDLAQGLLDMCADIRSRRARWLQSINMTLDCAKATQGAEREALEIDYQNFERGGQ